MKSISSLMLATATALFTASAVLGQTLEGCYSSTTGLTFNSTSIFESRGHCVGICGASGLQQAVMGMANSTTCWCGSEYPPLSSKVDASLCNTNCPGWQPDLCGGGTQYISIYLTGVTSSANNAPDSASDNSGTSTSALSTPSTATTSKASTITAPGQTVVVTAPVSSNPSSTSTSSSSSGGPSKAGIAAGVVVGIVAIAAISGGIFLFVRNKHRREVEEEYRRNAAVSNFIAGGKPPSSSGGVSSFTDMRLDPAVMAQRRMSDGSIADNQDYSRRILKVTNA